MSGAVGPGARRSSSARSSITLVAAAAWPAPATLSRWAALLAGAMMLAVVWLLGGATVALGTEPSLVPAGILEAGDPRSEGAAPGLVGSPVLVLLGVVTLGLATALVTAVIVRLSRRG